MDLFFYFLLLISLILESKNLILFYLMNLFFYFLLLISLILESKNLI